MAFSERVRKHLSFCIKKQNGCIKIVNPNEDNNNNKCRLSKALFRAIAPRGWFTRPEDTGAWFTTLALHIHKFFTQSKLFTFTFTFTFNFNFNFNF
jgi:hypothetical protein